MAFKNMCLVSVALCFACFLALADARAMKYVWKAKERKKYPLGQCRGPCYNDFDCGGNLVCDINPKGRAVPGCTGKARPGVGYCFRRVNRPHPEEERSPRDLGIRFSKVYFEHKQLERQYSHRLPLTTGDFPLDARTAYMLRQSKCISVVRQEDCIECDVHSRELIFQIGGYPTHATSDPNNPFWDEFRVVLNRQLERVNGHDPRKVLPLPDIWKSNDLDLETVAEYVHDEFPGTHHANLIRQFIGEGFKVNRRCVPSHSTTEFVRREVMLSYLVGWAVEKVGPLNFGVKYYVGRARPEEIAWQITTRELTSAKGVPKDIEDAVLRMNLKSQFNFTAYPEGSPTHPSWPAMHSAGSAASMWLCVILELSPEQQCQVRLVDWAVSYARTVAGVHYESDNIAGLNLGQAIIGRELPGFLAKEYGADPSHVEKLVEQYRFDWATFPDSDCYKNNIGKYAY